MDFLAGHELPAVEAAQNVVQVFRGLKAPAPSASALLFGGV